MELIQILKLLSDENKYRIVKLLMKGEVCVCAIAEELDLEQSLVSHHLDKLREAGLITDRKLGPWVHCSLNRDLFEKFGEEFRKEFAASNIKDKPCNIHDACCQLLEKKL